VYDANGRMAQAKRAGAAVMNYQYNGRGEQVRKFLGTTGTYTLYDETGHWLGDYDSTGQALQQAIWLDDLPVGVLASNSLHYVQPDHLGTPRAVIDPVRDVAIWKWDLKGEAFGNTPPNQDPDSDGTAFVFDMRFPGQRSDAATGFNQNYFRDYDPGTGRYGQSDPIGLKGGSGTYHYAKLNPFIFSDYFGLCPADESEINSDAPIHQRTYGKYWLACMQYVQPSSLITAPVSGATVASMRVESTLLTGVATYAGGSLAAWEVGSAMICGLGGIQTLQ